jgi:FKBP-type peptidyl-prolyl cis-trans isomerase SlyD
MGLVTKIGLENIDMDFNHPMAGKKLHFTGSISSVREATPDELSHGHVHGPGGHHH